MCFDLEKNPHQNAFTSNKRIYIGPTNPIIKSMYKITSRHMAEKYFFVMDLHTMKPITNCFVPQV
jgi:hypothetical protein